MTKIDIYKGEKVFYEGTRIDANGLVWHSLRIISSQNDNDSGSNDSNTFSVNQDMECIIYKDSSDYKPIPEEKRLMTFELGNITWYLVEK